MVTGGPQKPPNSKKVESDLVLCFQTIQDEHWFELIIVHEADKQRGPKQLGNDRPSTCKELKGKFKYKMTFGMNLSMPKNSYHP